MTWITQRKRISPETRPRFGHFTIEMQTEYHRFVTESERELTERLASLEKKQAHLADYEPGFAQAQTLLGRLRSLPIVKSRELRQLRERLHRFRRLRHPVRRLEEELKQKEEQFQERKEVTAQYLEVQAWLQEGARLFLEWAQEQQEFQQWSERVMQEFLLRGFLQTRLAFEE